MKLIYIYLISAIFLVSCGSGDKIEKNEIPLKPNILFILVDDYGINDLSSSGSTFYETPNIDKLATNGAVFTQGYACSRVCSPSRASIMTGKFAARHGITDWIGEKAGSDWRSMNRQDKLLPADYIRNLPAQDVTLAEVLKANGYKTFFAGKWHLGDLGSYPEDHGFDINKGGWDKGGPVGGYFSPFQNPKLEDKYDGENLSIRLANETADFMKQNKTSNFFAFLSFYAVHGPIQTSEDKWEKYRDKAENQGIKENGFVMERKLPIRQTQDNPVYAGLVESMDDAVGVVLEALKELQLDKNTIVIFTSDNGGVASGDSFSTSNLPYRGGKGYQWEGGIREPYFIYVPWNHSKIRSFDYPVTGADFYPTILDYANIKLMPDQHQDGISLKPMIETNSELSERPLFWHYPHYGNQGGDPSSIIRKGDWKLIHYYEDDSNELFNLKSDPYEQHNLADTNPEITSNLHDNLMKWLESVDAKFPETDTEFDASKRADYDKQIIEKLWPKLENERRIMLSKDFRPNDDWWGSKLTKD
ncbi:MAG TPA: sulfatase [Yeosuana sp.]